MGEAVLGRYAPAESAEALALDAACVQGRRVRLSFRRETFHARAQAWPEHVILTARLEGRLVGTLAVAAKAVELLGRPARAAFAFDLRVHPSVRGRGIARALAREGLHWAERHTDLAYAYSVDENRAAARVCELMGLTEVGGYAYLVCPAVGPRAPGAGWRRVAFAEARAAFRSFAGPFDLRTDLSDVGGPPGHVASWLLRDGADLAACSALSHGTTLAEVVERVPPLLRLARILADAGLPGSRRWPRVPRKGERLRSWYVFDAFATSPRLGGELVRQVAAEARAAGIDWCHVVHRSGDAWLAAARAELPPLFSPVLRYRLLARRFDGVPLARLARLAVDPRDL